MLLRNFFAHRDKLHALFDIKLRVEKLVLSTFFLNRHRLCLVQIKKERAVSQCELQAIFKLCANIRIKEAILSNFHGLCDVTLAD